MTEMICRQLSLDERCGDDQTMGSESGRESVEEGPRAMGQLTTNVITARDELRADVLLRALLALEERRSERPHPPPEPTLQRSLLWRLQLHGLGVVRRRCPEPPEPSRE